MATNFTPVLVAELNLNQIKRIEKVLIANGHNYFTDGTLSWDSANYDVAFSKNDGSYVVNASKIVDYIKDAGLVQAIKDEFSGVDLVQWVENNTYKRKELLRTF